MKKSFFLFLLMICFSSCASLPPQNIQHFTKSAPFFGSMVKVDICYTENQTEYLNLAVDEIWSRFADIHWRLSVYDPNSDLNRINRSDSQPVTVQADTYAIIKDALDYYHLADEEFDITIHPLIQLWKTAQSRNTLPTAAEIQNAQNTMGINRIKLLANNTIQLLTPPPKLNIDSIADGYAADEAARILRNHGFTDFLIDASGELYGSGTNCAGQIWTIGIQDPQHAGAIIDSVQIKNAAVTTSGNYEHFYTVEGKSYSHIISPKTGFPRHDILSATVIAPNTQFSDFWSTALCLLDPRRGNELIDALGAGYASLIMTVDKDGEIQYHKSRRYKNYSLTNQ